MATKNDIQTVINNNIRSNPALIDKTEHADVEDALLAATYPDGLTVNQASTAVITLNPLLAGQITYNANIYKQGRTVTMHISLFKNTTTLESRYIFEITNAEFLGQVITPPVGVPFICFSFPELGKLRDDNKFYFDALNGGIKQFTLIYQTVN